MNAPLLVFSISCFKKKISRLPLPYHDFRRLRRIFSLGAVVNMDAAGYRGRALKCSHSVLQEHMASHRLEASPGL